jgi:hypothetical protein
VYRAIKLSESKKFWKMQLYLSKETRDHVKQFITTYFFFEGSGSFTTLTKKERINYFNAENEQAAIKTENAKSFIANKNAMPLRWILIAKE